MRIIAVVLLFWMSIAGAQQPIDVMRADLAELKRKVVNLEKDAESEAAFRASQAAGMAELLSRQLAQVAPTKESAAAWVEGAAQARVELETAANAATFLAHAPADVKTLAKNCVLAAAGAQVSDKPQFSLDGCNTAQQQQLKEKLRELEAAAKESFDKCRRVVTDLAPEYESLVPRNPHDVDVALLEELAKYPDAAVRDCKSTIESAKQALTEIKDAKALLSNAMTMAANVCFASGGNPYVCGGMLALAILMEIFDGSGGGGNGDGPGEGPSEGGARGGQDVPTVSGGEARESDEGKAAREVLAKEAINQGPSANLGGRPGLAAGGGNLGTEGATTNISCNGGAARITCFIADKPNSERTFFGAESIKRLAATPADDAVTTCMLIVDGQLQIAGIALKEAKAFRAFAHNSKQSVDLGTYPTAAAACQRVKR